MRDDASNDRATPAEPSQREWVTPAYARVRAGDAEASPQPNTPEGDFGSS